MDEVKYETAQTRLAEQTQAQVGPEIAPQKKENMVTGLVGALLGALLGGASIVLLDQMGYVAAISGLILAVCTLKGYELLGGGLSGKGIACCVLLMLATPYVADRIGWAVVLLQEFPELELTFGEAFRAIPLLLEDGAIIMSEYIKSLLMVYGFVALGAFSTLRTAMKK